MPPEPFPHAALDANRSGHLTPDQTVLFRKEAGSDRGNLLFAGLAVGALGAAVVFGAVTGRIAGNRLEPLLVGLALLAVGIEVMYFGGIRGPRAKAAAAAAGRVTAIEGPIRRERRDRTELDDSSSHYAPGSEYDYSLFVGDRRFDVSQQAYDAAPEDGVVRVYLLGDSNRIVNLERTADAPPPKLPSVVQAAMERATQSGDPQKAAQAQALLRQAELMMAGEATSGSSAAAAPAAPSASANMAVPLGQAILGTWHSDLMGISYEFRADGSALASLQGHASGATRWKVVGPTTIQLDDSTLQAIVNGDDLSLGEPPKLLAFRRVG
jgi:hypothetical protein